MGHTIYKTEALIVGVSPRGEASAAFSLFTESYGLISARAQSVRRDKAKLKHVLNRHKKVSCALVAGKNGWRLIDVEERVLPEDLFISRVKYEVYAKILLWVTRFVGEEEEVGELYNEVGAMISFLGNHSFEEKDKEALEVLVALSLLHRFGYISPKEVEKEIEEASDFIFTPQVWEKEHLAQIQKKTRPLVLLINRGVEASNL